MKFVLFIVIVSYVRLLPQETSAPVELYFGTEQASGGSITFALSNQGQVWGGDLLGINCNINYYTTNLFNNSQAIVSVHNTLPQFWDGIHFTTSREGGTIEKVYGYGLYKVTTSESNIYFYLDYRDQRVGCSSYGNIGHHIDLWIKYNATTNTFSYSNRGGVLPFYSISNGQLLSFWQLKNAGTPQTWIFPDYWANSLVLITSQTGNHPRLVWGPYPSSSIAVEAYKVYRKIGSSSFAPCTTLSASTYQFTDESVYLSIPGGQAGTDVQYKVTAIYNTNNETSSTNTVTVNIQGDEMEKRSYSIPITAYNYNLEQSYPNPFNPNTKINYSISQAGFVTLKVFNILGKEVAVLVNEMKEAGYHSSEFNASNLPSGVYIYTLEVIGLISSKKMLLMK